MAAAVADATAGLAKLVQTPNEGIFSMGLLSMILAAGCELVFTIFTGNTFKAPGAAPMLQHKSAPLQTCCVIDASIPDCTGVLSELPLPLELCLNHIS